MAELGLVRPMSAGRIAKRLIVIAACMGLVLLLAIGWLFVREPGAQTEAKRFGQSVRATISDTELLAWAEKIASTPRGGAEHEIDVPRTDWPPQLIKLLEQNRWATATLSRDASGVPSGIRFRDGIVGIVIPLHGAIPETGYFSIHMIAPDCPYYAYSLFK